MTRLLQNDFTKCGLVGLLLAIVFMNVQTTNALSCPKIKNTDQNSPIVSKQNVADIHINDTNTGNNTVLYVTCRSTSYEVNGSDIITCKNGEWDPPAPECIPKPPPVPQTDNKIWYIVGGSAAGGGVLFIVILIITIICCCKRNKKPSGYEYDKKALEMTSNPRLSNGAPDGVSVIRSASQYGMTPLNTFYKVWSLNRTTKKLVRADNLRGLIQKVGPMFGIRDPLKLVLEEDGTEIDNDEALCACAEKTFIALPTGQRWSRDVSIRNDKPRLTFDICSYDRATRKLILANSLKDLLNQASICLDYPAEYACLEEDGTMIEDDDSLVAFAGSTLMILGKGHAWKTPGSGVTSDKDEGQNRLSEIEISNTPIEQTDDDGKKLFKVWSSDGRERKIIIANDLIDLHIKAARVFNLSTPIQISVFNENFLIHNDSALMENVDKTLIVSQAPEVVLPLHQRNSFDNPIFEHENFTDVTSSPEVYRNRPKSDPNQKDRASRSDLDYGGNYDRQPPIGQVRKQTNEFKNGGILDQNRFGSSNLTPDAYKPQFSASSDTPTKHFHENDQYLTATYFDPPSVSSKSDEYHSYDYENMSSKPYQNDGNAQNRFQSRPTQSRGNLSSNHGKPEVSLPYANLSPLHKQYQKTESQTNPSNNFESKDQNHRGKKDKKDKKSKSMRPEVDMSDYRGSYLATGGASQSGHSDVYY